MSRYNSKKFIVVMTMIILTALLAGFGKMTGDVAAVFAAIGAIYPAAQSYVDGRRNDP